MFRDKNIYALLHRFKFNTFARFDNLFESVRINLDGTVRTNFAAFCNFFKLQAVSFFITITVSPYIKPSRY